jgi:hypothetical protein
VNATGWSRGLEVTAGGTGVVSHAGLVLLRELADRTGLPAALPSPQGGMTAAGSSRTWRARSLTGPG